MDDPSTSVVLRDQTYENGQRYAAARMTEHGDLELEGQDLGDGVERAFGPGLREYEWALTVRRTDLVVAARVLGASGPDTLLDVLQRGYGGDRVVEIKASLEAAGVPFEFWSRVGD